MRGLFSFLICVVVSTAAFAQETNCTNGLDDDGDGFIDCYDSDCALNSACDDIFIGNSAECTLTPPPAPAFTMELDFESANETTNHFARIAIGDLDRDGIPEIVTMNKYTKKLIILNGNGGSIKHEAVMANGAEPEWEIAIANINDDNCAEIFFLTSTASPAGERSKIYVYDCQLNFLYSTPSMPNNSDPINFGIADFGGDGRSEIYCKDEIFNAHTGARLRATGLAAADWQSRLNGGPVAVDMDLDGDLELVIGLTIYNVNAAATTLTVSASRPEYFIRNSYNATSVADYNQDGHMDVIASGSVGCHGNNTTIFFWDVFNNTLRTYSDHNAINGDSDYEDGWQNGTGRVNIADLDGDGQLNLSYVSGGFLYALREDLTLLWRKVIKEETSGYTGCTLFDFNGDGKSEIVYRDEENIYIIDGTDGSTYDSRTCISRTNREYPIVADVDADGATEICVTCGFDDDDARANFTTTSYSRYSHVRVFASALASEPWVPARRVWNQHGYFVVNVNDDLTIPILQQNHIKTFSTVACRPGDPVGPVRPLNKFLNQSPFIDTNGCPAYLAPDLNYQTNVTFTAPECPNLDFIVDFTITNLGEVSLTGDVYVSYYDSDPTLSGATKLGTSIFPVTDLDTDEAFVIKDTILSNGSDSLYVVLNDAGTSVPVNLPNTPILECDYDNIRGIRISPLPVALTAQQVTPNELCAVPPTGSAEAFVPTATGTPPVIVPNTADYDFYWFRGDEVGAIDTAHFTGPIISAVRDGEYSVFAIHKTANCSSDTALVVINDAPGVLPTVTVTKISDQTNCDPANGSLQAQVAGPAGNAGYTFEWEDIAAPIGVSGPLLANQSSGTYTVIVTHTASGCETSADGTIGDLTQEPDLVASATGVGSCINLNSGTVTAEAFVGSVAQPDADYTFNWYFYDNATSTRGSLLPAIHGAAGTPDRTGLPIGFYQVEIEEIATGCPGTTTEIVEVTDDREVPTVQITELAPQTSCDVNDPNGRLQALVSFNGVPQNAADYTFQWFVGQNTLPANAHTDVSGTNGSIAENIKGGGQSYTVLVRNAFNCSAVTDTVITEIINVPIVTLTTNPNGICNPALASSAFTGDVTATVTFGGVPVVFPNPSYSIQWFNGTQAIGVPRPETTPALTQLDSGFYTVVVSRTDLNCVSTPETEFVDNTTVLPVITATANASTNCLPLLPGVNANGGVQVTDVDGIGTPANFDFEWHRGNTTAGQLVASAAVSPDTLQGKVGGFYTVLVTNTDDGCQSTETVEVTDAHVLPALSLAPFPNGICNPSLTSPSVQFNGRVESTITNQGVNPLTDYRFTWTDQETNTQVLQAVGAAGEDLLNRDSSYYSLVVRQLSTGCESSISTAQVTANKALPNITATANPSTNCLPLIPGVTPNGGVQVTDVNGAGTPATNTYEWHRGTTISGPLVASTAVSLDTLQGKVGGFYTVLVTKNSDGCQSTETVEVTDAHVLPALSLAPFPNGICNPGLTSPSVQFNGRVESTITNQGVNPLTDYRFTWTDQETNTQVLQAVGAAGEDLLNRDSSYYSLIVRQLSTGCESNISTAQVTANKVLPVVTATANASTNCLPLLPGVTPNGGVQVTDVDGAGTPATNTYEWHRGNTIAGYLVASTAASLDTLQGDIGRFYTVIVTKNSDGCQRTETVEVVDDHELPLITLGSRDNTICSGTPNGKAFLATLVDRGVNVPSPFAGYTFAWENPPGSSTDSLLNVVAGNYSLKVTNIATGCASDSASVDVDEDLYTPQINIAATNQTSCDVSDLNSQLAATIDETTIGGGAAVTGGYTFAWVDNGNPFGTPGTSAGNTATINDIPGNLFYTVTVVRTATGCDNTETIFLPEIITYPIVAAAVSSNVTRCDSPDGNIVANVGGTATGYTFFWLNEVGSNQTADDTTVVNNADANFTNNGTYASLIPGYYTVVARDDNTSCLSQPITRQVLDATLTSLINLAPTAIPSSCGVNGGELTAIITGGTGTTYDVIWHSSGPINDSINFFNNPPQFDPVQDTLNLTVPGITPGPPGAVLDELYSGIYTVVVRDNGNGCGNYQTIFLPFNNAHNITTNLIHSTLCPYTLGNGQIEVTVGNITGGNDFQDYTYRLYNGQNPIPGNQLGPVAGPGAGTFNPQVYASLKPGMYTVEVRQDPAAFGSSCAVYGVVEIEPHAFAPIVDIAGTVANTACNMAAADGEATVEIDLDPNDQTTGFNFNIDVTPNPLGTGDGVIGPYLPPPLPDTYTMTGLRPNNVVLEYTVRVTNSVSNCFTDRVVSISNQPATPELIAGNVIATNALACDITLEAAARAEVTDISIIGGGADNLNFYEFNWFTDAALTTNIYSLQGDATATDGGEVFENGVNAVPAGTVTAGSYWIVATKNAAGQPGNGCLTAPFKVDILDDSVNPTVQFTASPNTACDNNFEGAVRVQVTNSGSMPAVNYTYTFTTAVTPITPPPTSNGDGLLADDNFGLLEDGLYTVQVENNSSGCITSQPATITQSATPIIVATTNHTDQLICDPDGSITVVDILVGGAADPTHTNFDFTWYKDDPANEIVAAAQGNDLLDLADFPVVAGTYFVKASRRPATVPPPTVGSGCESAPVRVDILDISRDPVIAFTPSPNTACDNNFEGALRVQVTDAGSVAAVNYTYTFTTVVTPIVPPATSNGDGLLADDNFGLLEEGLYEVEVENNTTGCVTTQQATITQFATPIIVATTNKTDQVICDPDGSITVVDILVGGVSDPTHTNFDFTWYKDDPANEIVAAAQGNDLLDLTDFPVVAGTYFVKASRRALTVPPPTVGSGCESAPVRVDILDTSRDPVIAFTPSPNTACDNNFEGALRVQVTDAGSVAAVNYTYTFTTVVTPIVPPATSNGDGLLTDDNFGLLEEGLYEVEVENNTTGCVTTQQATITQFATPIIVATTNKTDQLICDPDGSITVVDVLVGGVPDVTHNNFDFTWYKDDLATEIVAATQGNDLLDLTDFPIVAGTYFVKASRRALTVPPPTVGSGCESAPVRVDILDLSVDPDLEFTSIRPDSSCNPMNPLGLILATASERDGTTDNYTFIWTYNGGGLAGPPTTQNDATPVSSITNAPAGNYVVVVRNTVTGCDFNQGATLILDQTRSLPNIVNVLPTNPLDCFPTGSAAVVEITIGGTTTLTNPPDDINTNFDYQWYRASVPAGLIAGETNSTLLNQLPDRYFVQVEDLTTNCPSGLVEVVIDTLSITYPDIVIQQTAPQISCSTITGSGILVATADGQNDTNPNYTFTWFASLDLSGASIANTSTVNNLFSGDYSVRAFNSLTNCSSSELYIVENDSIDFFPQMALTSDPLTECDSIDGSVFIRGLHFPVTSNPANNYPFTYSYTADLYDGAPPADINTPEFPNVPNDPNNPLFLENFMQPNLPDGLYTVRLTDNNTGCFSIDTVSVQNGQVFPLPVVAEVSPVTNCMPLGEPNGVARALVDGTFVGYSFEWFEGTVPAGSPLFVGPEFGELRPDPTQYVVRATNLVTGCSDSTVISISNEALPIPIPDITVLAHRTSCDPVAPNGMMTVDVDGNSIDYIFNWYNGVAAPPLPTPDFVGQIYDSLDVGMYSVNAISRITGCVSPVETEQIIHRPDLPDIDFDIVKALCGLSNGSIILSITTDVPIDTVQWYFGFFTDAGNPSGGPVPGAVGPILSEAFAGDYSVQVTTILGCESFKNITLDTEIRPYNGISRASTPGQNDYFHIDCIENFPKNVVRIYNRAGTLVFEQVGYDNFNLETRFTGTSNKGVSPMGTNLPDGTYFYIVDKKDGSKPLAGYIEIVQ